MQEVATDVFEAEDKRILEALDVERFNRESVYSHPGFRPVRTEREDGHHDQADRSRGDEGPENEAREVVVGELHGLEGNFFVRGANVSRSALLLLVLGHEPVLHCPLPIALAIEADSRA